MSRIEDALKKLQSGKSPPAAPSSARAPRYASSKGDTSDDAPARKKVTVDGPRHHVSIEHLMRGGLLAPPELASHVADEFRRIKRPLLANAASSLTDSAGHMNVIMIASGLPGAGKTFCAVNLAASISLERELNVVLVDADVPKPHISQTLGLREAPGLIDLLVDETLDLSDLLVRTDFNDIQVLPAGRRHRQATELLASERMSQVVAELALRYRDRIIVIDSPPLLITSEAQALADKVGQIALVVEAGATSHQVLQQTLETLDETKAINLILNKNRHWGAASYYDGEYYASYYGSREHAPS
jgi:protein-tyrosine kinase